MLFDNQTTIKGKSVFEHGRISVSFSKTREGRFIISGIISAPDPYQVKVQVKLEDGDEKSLSSNCNCKNWSDEYHCEHAAALYLHYQISQATEQTQGKEGDLRSHISFHGQSVHVENYGRIERGANKLLGAQMNSTYSSLQYLLTNRKKIHFPLPSKVDGKVIVNFVPTADYEEFEKYPHLNSKYFPLFSYENANGDKFEKISIFENLYLFNWENGELFNLPAQLSHVVKIIQNLGLAEEINQLIKITSGIADLDFLEIQIKGTHINLVENQNPNIRFSIHPAKRKGFLDFNIELFDEQNRTICPPPLFKIITGDGGFLNSFRTKADSYEFLKALMGSITYENQEYKKFAYSASQRSKLIEWVDYVMTNDEVVFYDEMNNCLYELKTVVIKDIILGMFECFSESAARFQQVYLLGRF